MGIFLPQRWRHQPYGSFSLADDVAHEDSLAYVAPYKVAVGVEPSRQTASYSPGNSFNVQASPYGVSTASLGGFSGLYAPATNRAIVGRYAIFAIVSMEKSGASSLFGRGNSGSPDVYVEELTFGRNQAGHDTEGKFRFSFRGVTSGQIDVSPTDPFFALSEWHTVALINIDKDNFRLFIDGREVAVSYGLRNWTPAPSMFDAKPFAIHNFVYGNSANTQPTYNGGNNTNRLAMLAKLAVTPDVALRYVENPWQIFKPRRHSFYSFPVGDIVPNIPTLSLPGVTNITDTSARPHVTLTY